MAKDNSTIRLKTALRLSALREIANPIVCETHGGYGRLYYRCYQELPYGVVFETDQKKSAALARQRPTWAVYEADCTQALRAGCGFHWPLNFFDLDPYGEPWPVVDAIFESGRLAASRLVLVVNDGLRQKIRLGGGWSVKSLAAIVGRVGNDILHDNYLAVCRDMLTEKAARAGYQLVRWAGYYCGAADGMTHYAAVLERETQNIDTCSAPAETGEVSGC